MHKAVAAAVVLVLAAVVWQAYRGVQRDACFTAGAASDEYAGLTLVEARQEAADSGDDVRVVGRDGTCLDATSDVRNDRVNVYLEDGRVAQARRY